MTKWTAAELALDPPPTPSIDGDIRIGSDAHKALFCSMLLDTFNLYRPAVIDWPRLDAEARERLVGLPIWDIASPLMIGACCGRSSCPPWSAWRAGSWRGAPSRKRPWPPEGV